MELYRRIRDRVARLLRNLSRRVTAFGGRDVPGDLEPESSGSAEEDLSVEDAEAVAEEDGYMPDGDD